VACVPNGQGLALHATCANGAWSDPGDCNAITCARCECRFTSLLNTLQVLCEDPSLRYVPIGLPTNITRFFHTPAGSSLSFNLAPLAGHPNLKEVTLSSVLVEDQAIFNTLPQLQRLTYSNCAFTTRSYLVPLHAGQLIDLQFNGLFTRVQNGAAPLVANLSLLQAPKLGRLLLSDFLPLQSLSLGPAGAFPRLEALSVPVKDCDATHLSSLTTLKSLDLSCDGTPETHAHLATTVAPQENKLIRFILTFKNAPSLSMDVDLMYAALDWQTLRTKVLPPTQFEDYITADPTVLGNSNGQTLCVTSARANDLRMVCRCGSPPFQNASYCPLAVPLPCEGAASAPVLLTQVCDGQRDCRDGSEESACAAELRLVHHSALSNRSDPSSSTGLPAHAASLLRCTATLAVTLERGILHFPGRPLDSACFTMYGVLHSASSAGGNTGASTFR
jgi:hypothetical protein